MWNNLKASIAAVIRTNNNQEITGANLQGILNTIVNSVGANATFAGIATPSTNPGTPDGPVFYIAYEPGVYSNFNITTVDGLYILENKTGSWVGTRISTTGTSGTTFTPHVDSNGNLSWTNDGGKPNPETVNIKGPQGDTVILGNGTTYKLYNSTGQNTDGAMTQKAVTDKIAEISEGQGTLVLDDTPTAGSNNPVKSNGIKVALDAKQDELIFDDAPTANSNNPVKSSGIKTAIDAKQDTINTVNVTIDSNTGTPSGSASVNGGTLLLSFQNLKGTPGATGATGPQGPRGLPGPSGVTGDVSGFTVHQDIDPYGDYYGTDIAGAATVQATNQELTELEGEVNDVLQKTVASPAYEKGKISNTGTFTSDASYGTVRPIKLYDGDTIMLNLGSPLYHGYNIATLFRCDSTGTFIETLITGSGTSSESWTNTTGDTIYVGISGYKAQTGYIISKDIKSSFEFLDEEIGDNINYSFDVAAGSSTPTTEKMDVDIAAGDTFYIKISDSTGDGITYYLYFQYDGQSSGTSMGAVLSGTTYKYTASQKIDKIYLWKGAVSTNKTVRIDVWTGLLGQISLTESGLMALKNASVRQAILSEAYTITSVTRNTSGNVTAASIVYPDGVTGTMTVTRNSAGAATSAVYTYGTSTYTLTITRDSNNNVTATSLS